MSPHDRVGRPIFVLDDVQGRRVASRPLGAPGGAGRPCARAIPRGFWRRGAKAQAFEVSARGMSPAPIACDPSSGSRFLIVQPV